MNLNQTSQLIITSIHKRCNYQPTEWITMFVGTNWIQSLIPSHCKSLLQEMQQLSYYDSQDPKVFWFWGFFKLNLRGESRQWSKVPLYLWQKALRNSAKYQTSVLIYKNFNVRTSQIKIQEGPHKVVHTTRQGIRCVYKMEVCFKAVKQIPELTSAHWC